MEWSYAACLDADEYLPRGETRPFELDEPKWCVSGFHHERAHTNSLKNVSSASAAPTYCDAAGDTRVQNSLNSVLSKNANALTILPSRMVRNHA